MALPLSSSIKRQMFIGQAIRPYGHLLAMISAR
jgi:hypothetical protein